MFSQAFPPPPASAYPLVDLRYSLPFNLPRHLPAQPQMTAKGIVTYVAVRTQILSNLKRVCEEMFPEGRQEGEIYRTGFIEIGLDGFHSYTGGAFYGPGSWLHSLDNVYGPDLVSLIAYWHGWTYEQALDCCKGYFGLIDEKVNSLDVREPPGWQRETNPLRCAFERDVVEELHSFSLDKRQHVYRNASSVPILIADEWINCRDGLITTYQSLCRRKRDDWLCWLALPPRAPFPLFNADNIAANPTMPVHFVGTEAEAEGFDPGAIYSTVPGGLRNLVDAETAPLAGRAVEVVLSPADMVNGALIREKLHTTGVEALRFRLTGEHTSMSFERLEEIADRRGIMLEKPSYNIGRIPAIGASMPGETIPGSDVVRKMLFDPIILQSEIIWVYAPPKVGKSLFALATSDAISTGSARVGKWFTDEPSGVLHVDGEMAPDQLQKLIDMVLVGAGKQPGDRRFAVLCAKSFPDGIIDLETEEGRNLVEKSLNGIKLLVLDNFQSLTSNSPGALRAVLPWLRKITRMGVAVLVLDHTNRDGDIQGSIAKERIADLTVSLRYPDEDAKAEGRILVEFPAPRRLHGEDAQEFQLRKVFTKATEQAPASFRFELVESPETPSHSVPSHIARMALVVFAKDRLSLSYPEIEQRYGIARSTAHGNYKASKEVTGADREALEGELRRIAEEHKSTLD